VWVLLCGSGTAENKSLQDLLPGIINQLGSDNLENLKSIAEQYQVSPHCNTHEKHRNTPSTNFEHTKTLQHSKTNLGQTLVLAEHYQGSLHCNTRAICNEMQHTLQHVSTLPNNAM